MLRADAAKVEGSGQVFLVLLYQADLIKRQVQAQILQSQQKEWMAPLP